MRIAVVGVSESGKTTLAHALGPTLQLPILSTDDFRDTFVGLTFEQQVECAWDAVQGTGPLLAEGIHLAPLFSRGYRPDVLIHCSWVFPKREAKGINEWLHAGVEVGRWVVPKFYEWHRDKKRMSSFIEQLNTELTCRKKQRPRNRKSRSKSKSQ